MFGSGKISSCRLAVQVVTVTVSMVFRSRGWSLRGCRCLGRIGFQFWCLACCVVKLQAPRHGKDRFVGTRRAASHCGPIFGHGRYIHRGFANVDEFRDGCDLFGWFVAAFLLRSGKGCTGGLPRVATAECSGGSSCLLGARRRSSCFTILLHRSGRCLLLDIFFSFVQEFSTTSLPTSSLQCFKG